MVGPGGLELTDLALISIEVPGLGVSFFAIPDGVLYARYTAATLSNVADTKTRIPRTHARPQQTAGSRCIRSRRILHRFILVTTVTAP